MAGVRFWLRAVQTVMMQDWMSASIFSLLGPFPTSPLIVDLSGF
jgi:hypothetical protein